MESYLRDQPLPLPSLTQPPNFDYTYPQSANVATPNLVKSLIARISVAKRRQLTQVERIFVINKVRALDYRQLQGNTNDLVAALTELIGKRMESMATGSLRGNIDFAENIDMHELMRESIGTTSEQGPDYSYGGKSIESIVQESFEPTPGAASPSSTITSFLGASDTMRLCREINPESTWRRNYVVFDTRYRNPTFGATNTFTWDFMTTLTQANGSVSIYGLLRDLVQVRVFPVRIPYALEADTDQRLISLNIAEFSPQSFVAHENARFHFMFKSTVDGNWIDLQPWNYNDGYFRFQKPITRLDRLSLTFGDPLSPITFDADRSEYTVAYGLLTTITTPEPHNLQTGDVVFFDNFNTLAPTLNSAAINQMNSSRGLAMTFIGANSFSVPVDTSTCAPPPAIRLTVYFGSKRAFIPMELVYIDPTLQLQPS